MELCEWNPTDDKPAEHVPGIEGSRVGCTNEATVSIGSKVNWHLCDGCAGLPRFNKYRKRVKLGNARTNVK